MSITLRNAKGSPLTHDEMDVNFSALTGSLDAGDGLTGGGNRIDSIEFNVGAGDGISVSADAVAVDGTVARRNQDNTFTGNVTIEGDLTARQLIVSSSVTHLTQSFSSGSTIFGDTLDDTHLFTGSVFITGSLGLPIYPTDPPTGTEGDIYNNTVDEEI